MCVKRAWRSRSSFHGATVELEVVGSSFGRSRVCSGRTGRQCRCDAPSGEVTFASASGRRVCPTKSRYSAAIQVGGGGCIPRTSHLSWSASHRSWQRVPRVSKRFARTCEPAAEADLSAAEMNLELAGEPPITAACRDVTRGTEHGRNRARPYHRALTRKSFAPQLLCR